nr:P1 [Red mite associated cystovirus]
MSKLTLRKAGNAVPSLESRVAIHITSTIDDRYAGTSTTEVVWANTVNTKFFGRAVIDEVIRLEVADFFVERRLFTVLKKMIPVAFFKPGETAFTKDDLYEAVSASGNGPIACGAIMELILPSFIKLGMVSDAIAYSRQMTYGFKTPTVRMVRDEVLTYQTVEATKAIKIAVEGKDRVSRSVFAELVAEQMRQIGLTLHELTDLSNVVEDMVLGVRAHLDPLFSIDSSAASVPHEWRKNRIIEELAHNLVFVKAALALPVGERLRLKTAVWQLDKWAPVVMTALKSSERYVWQSKDGALNTVSVRKARDVKGTVVGAVVGRNIEVQPVAQAVFAVADVGMADAHNISATKDRLAESVQAAYGKATFNLLQGADMVLANLRDYAEAGWKSGASVYIIDVSEGSALTATDIALLTAERVYVTVSSGAIVVDKLTQDAIDAGLTDIDEVWSPAWWFSVPTTERSMNVWSGTHMGDEIITSDPAEVILAGPERDARAKVPARQQLLSAAAFNTRLLDFDNNILVAVDERFSFSIEIGGLKLQGKMAASDFASLRSGPHISLVKPFFNAEVIDGLEKAYTIAHDMNDKVAKSGDEDWEHNKANAEIVRFIKRRHAREMLLLAQQLSPAFRSEVQQVMIEQSLNSKNNTLSASDSELFRAQMHQKAFGAYCDLMALRFFLMIQGIDVSMWEKIMTSTDMGEVCLEFGSDRS